jgi:hypothetical protein
MIAQRNWVLARSAPDGTGYITSDRPVSLIWRDPKEHFGAPGLAHLDTELIFPISNYLAIIGAFEAKDAIAPASEDVVARINTVTISQANRQIYARDNGFKYLTGPEGSLQSGDALVDDSHFSRKCSKP